MIAFIDTEVSFQNKQAKDFGVVREDGAVLHTHSLDEFQKFIYDCEYICGHNIIKFDLKYSSIKGKHIYIDTLPLSPLLFPNKPYHRLVKDDKLQVEELNNPVNDAKKAKDLFFDEAEAWKHLSIERKLTEYKPDLRKSRQYEDKRRQMEALYQSVRRGNRS